MPTANLIKTGGVFLVDIFLRLFLFSLYAIFQVIPPFKRIIHPEEAWLYKNPVTDSYCPMNLLWEIVIVIPSTAIFVNYLINKDKTDVLQAFLAFSLVVSLNGALTNIFKVLVGRPRPDFYFRCFPDGHGNDEMAECSGKKDMINDGRKSFPSGHSSIAFASMGFLSLYLASKLHLFAVSGKGSAWRMLLALAPIVLATAIAISRTCDYHHHWQDVACGSALGFGISWLCYFHYYPALNSDVCHIPWSSINSRQLTNTRQLNIKDV